MATSSASKSGKKAVQRRSATTTSRTRRPAASSRSARAPSLGHAGNAIKLGVADTLKQMQAI